MGCASTVASAALSLTCARSWRPLAGSATRSRAFDVLPIANLYIHLPFCKHKCGYCDFNAYAGMDRLMPDYIDALERELATAREQRDFSRLSTVYFGGGTPSLLPAELIARLLRFIRGTF